MNSERPHSLPNLKSYRLWCARPDAHRHLADARGGVPSHQSSWRGRGNAPRRRSRAQRESDSDV